MAVVAASVSPHVDELSSLSIRLHAILLSIDRIIFHSEGEMYDSSPTPDVETEDEKISRSPPAVVLPSRHAFFESDYAGVALSDSLAAECILQEMRYLRNACALSLDVRQRILEHSQLMLAIFRLSAAAFLRCKATIHERLTYEKDAVETEKSDETSAAESKKLLFLYQSIQTVIFQFLFNVLQEGEDNNDLINPDESLRHQQFYPFVWNYLKILIPELLGQGADNNVSAHSIHFANMLSAVLYKLVQYKQLAREADEDAYNTVPNAEIMDEFTSCAWLSAYVNLVASFSDDLNVQQRLSWGLAMCVKIIAHNQCAKMLFPKLPMPAKSLAVELISLHLCCSASPNNVADKDREAEAVTMPFPVVDVIMKEFKAYCGFLLRFAHVDLRAELSPNATHVTNKALSNGTTTTIEPSDIAHTALTDPDATDFEKHENSNLHLFARRLLDVVERCSSNRHCLEYMQRSHHDLLDNVVNILRQIHDCGLGSEPNNFSVKVVNTKYGIKYYENLVDHPIVGLKRDLICVLGYMCYNDTESQDKLFDMNALTLLLDMTQVDGLNPFIQQWSILALRHALAGNKRNQDFVQSLQLQRMFNADDVAKMGLQAEALPVQVHDFGAPNGDSAADGHVKQD